MKKQSKKDKKHQERDSDLLAPGEELLMTKEEIDQELAKAIREERKKAGLSTRELSKRIGHSPSYIHKIETNQLETSTTELGKIARALNKPPGYFFPGVFERRFGVKIGKSKLDIIREIKERIEMLESIEAHEEQKQVR